MYQDFDEKIDVIALFEHGGMKPLRFRWKERSMKVTRVTGAWKAPKGDKWVRHFSVVDTQDNVYVLAYDERGMQWTISKIWIE